MLKKLLTGISKIIGINKKNELTKSIWIAFTIFCVVAVVSLTLTTLYAETSGSASFQRTRPAVKFVDRYHDSHMENFQCTHCHHKYVEGKNVLEEEDLEEGNPDILCSSCHNRKTKINLTSAFHRECIGCHDKLSAKGEKTGPSLCGECHIRQKVETSSLVSGG